MLSKSKKHFFCWLGASLLVLLFMGGFKNQAVYAATDLVADIASYQPSDLAFFRSLKSKGVKAVTIKITEGTGYTNPRAAAQIKNAKTAGLAINVYHYAQFNSSSNTMNNPVPEANYFTKVAKSLSIPKSAVMALDIEQPATSTGVGNYTNPTQITNDINAFSAQVHNNGYDKTATYSMRSWFSGGRILANKLRDPNLWIAEYGTSSVGYPTNAWQFTSTWNSGYQNNLIDMTYVYDGYLSHTSSSFVIVDKQLTSKKAVLTSKDYGLFNTPSPVAGSKLLIAGNTLNKQTVDIAAKYKVSNGEYYYNFKYGDRYYWTNTRAFSDVVISSKKTVNQNYRISSKKYGFYNTPANLNGSKQLIAPNQVPQTTVPVNAEYTLNDGTSYYNFKYGSRYYWIDTRACVNADIVAQESISKDVQVTSKNHGFYNMPANLSGAQQIITGDNVPLTTVVHAIAKYTLKDGTSYYNFKYGERYYWADTRAFNDVVSITKKEVISQELLINSKQYGFYNTPADLPNSQRLIEPSQVPQVTVNVNAKYTLSNGLSYYNFKYGSRYYWCDTRAFAPNTVTITSKQSIDLNLEISSKQFGFYNTPASLANAEQLMTPSLVPQVIVRVIAKYTLSDGTSHYNFKYGERYYWCDSRAFKTAVVTIVEKKSLSHDLSIVSKQFGFYNTPGNLPGAQLLIAASQVPQTTVHVIAQYTLNDGTSYYNFKCGSRYYWADTRAFK